MSPTENPSENETARREQLAREDAARIEALAPPDKQTLLQVMADPKVVLTALANMEQASKFNNQMEKLNKKMVFVCVGAVLNIVFIGVLCLGLFLAAA